MRRRLGFFGAWVGKAEADATRAEPCCIQQFVLWKMGIEENEGKPSYRAVFEGEQRGSEC